MMKKLLLICLPFVTTMVLAQKTDEAAKYAALITPQALKEKLTILASAEMEGRETASPGQKKAAAWIEEQFKSFGLKPGNGDSYQQVYPVYFDAMSDQLLRVNGKTFGWDKDYNFSLQTIFKGTKAFSNFVFAGYGVVDSASKTNDYAGLDVKGKVVIILDGGTPAATPAPGGGRRGFANPLTLKLNAAQKNGAIGVLVVTSAFPRTTPTTVKSTRMVLQITEPTIFSANISDEVASALIGRTSKVAFADFKNVNKGNYTAELQLGAVKNPEMRESSNVIGIIPGTDKKDEYIFLTGHYDHLGKNATGIFYGADDDGSGSVGVIQMAEAFAAAAKKGNQPRRTMIFMTVSGEEKGLLGSEYYSDHPTIDLSKASADLNTDMIGRGDSSRKGDTLNYIYVIGHDKLSSDLAPINESVNKLYNINLGLDYKYDDPNDQNRIYFRSDHYNFARKGIPILFFYDGMLGADYHKQSDTVDKIQFDVMAKRTQLVFHTAWVFANRDNMLKRDTPLNMPAR